MFEYLPMVTKDDVKAVRKHIMPLLLDSANECTERMVGEHKTAEWAIDCVCRELEQVNPTLVPAVKAVADAVAIQLRGKVESEPLWRAEMMAIVSVLALLRLINRALEAKEKEKGDLASSRTLD